MDVDWLITGGRVETFDPELGTVAALAIQGGRVVAAGADVEMTDLIGSAARHTDLAGATVLPGFIDTHMHLEKVSHEFTMLRLEHARNVGDIVDTVADRVSQLTTEGLADTWIRCFADNAAWHENNLVEGRLPTRAELDAAAPTTPVYLYRRPDRAVINSAGAELVAAKLTGLGATEYDPSTGYLYGPPVRVVNDAIYTLSMGNEDYRQRILADACQRLLNMGITTVVDPGLAGAFDPAWSLYQHLRSTGQLAQRVRLMNRFDWRQPFGSELQRLLQSSALPNDGDDRLQAWAVKLLLDGEFTNAWMRDGEDTAGKSHPHYTLTELRELLQLCAARGWPICIHAMGGGAIAAVTDTVAALRAAGVTFFDGQVNLAHAFLIDVPDLLACTELGIKISANPVLAHVYSGEMRTAWGPLAARTVPLATMAALGFRTAAGSDTHPCAPLAGAAIAVTRTAWDGSTLGAHEAVTPRQALTMYTRDAGHYLNTPELGTLAVGSAADLTIWPTSPLDTDPTSWAQLQPTLVAIAGEEVYSAAEPNSTEEANL